jgi:hypothetical protein
MMGFIKPDSNSKEKESTTPDSKWRVAIESCSDRHRAELQEKLDENTNYAKEETERIATKFRNAVS